MISRIFRAIVIVGALASLGGAASASTQTHRREAEVNQRIVNQDHRIAIELRKGRITVKQARALFRQERMVRNEERFMARQHHGHITRAERRALNQQENALARKIGV